MIGRCKSCDFWQNDEPQYTYGMCHRYPPVPDTMQRRAQPVHANTHENDWCGEYRFTAST